MDRDSVQAQQRRQVKRHRRRHRRLPLKVSLTDEGGVDWAKFTNLRSKLTTEDLSVLCEPLMVENDGRNKLKDRLERPDETGLCPMHWAAINNRADFINALTSVYDCSVLTPCSNRMLSNGTPLHLAAMNGSLEAAAAILSSWRQKRYPTDRSEILHMPDADGQTPLMRTAAPKTRRMNLLYDLLRKNFWSLNSRPAEIALYFIGQGADWTKTEPINGMNLLHLAIINDHDDIVNLLLVLDVHLIDVRVGLDHGISSVRSSSVRQSNEQDNEQDALTKPLLDKKNAIVEQLMNDGLRPLELAILYRRVGMMSSLWSVTSQRTSGHSSAQIIGAENLKLQLLKACFTNKEELVRFLKPLLFRAALLIDFSLYALVWVPFKLQYSFNRLVFSSFILSTVATIAFAFRVSMKDPGYLRANSVQYLSEMSQILARRTISTPDRDTNQIGKPVDLIKLDDKKMLVRRPNSIEGNIEAKAFTRILVPEEVKKGTSEKVAEIELSERVRLLCHKCRCIRKPRSKHCDNCNQCVQDFDHHCIYLGCCIGRLNRLDFLMTLIMLTASSLYATIVYLVSSPAHISITSSFWHFVGFVSVFKYALIGGYSAFAHLRRASLGVTMYEEIRAKRIRNNLGQDAADRIKKRQFWRLPPNRFLTGELSMEQISKNLYEFANQATIDEYLLGLIGTDTPLIRSIAIKSGRINMYKFA